MSTATDESTSHKSLIIDDDDTTALDDATSAEFAGLIAEVRSSLPAAAVEADEESTEEESKDQVHHLNEHMDINGLTLDEKSDNDTHTHSGASSASNSVSASPAVAPSASSTSASSHAAMAALPTVELKDGGNAIIQDTSEPKKDFFDVRVAIVGNVDSGQDTQIHTHIHTLKSITTVPASGALNTNSRTFVCRLRCVSACALYVSVYVVFR